jgi:hypothetical protein
MYRPSLLLSVLSTALLAVPAMAEQREAKPAASPLVELLKAKHILTEEEAATLTQSSSPGESDRRLAQLLLSKGLITRQEFERIAGSASAGFEPISGTAAGSDKARIVLASSSNASTVAERAADPQKNSTVRGSASPGQQGFVPAVAPGDASPILASPGTIPPIAPIRALPIDVPKPEGLLGDLRLGSGARLRLYGFLKASAIESSASSGGPIFGSDDFPLPLLLGDTGPNGDPQFHVKARSSRVGIDFGWPDITPNLALTGKLEFDFEGDFTSINNRNISSARSPQPSLRLGWVRADTKIGQVPWFVQFGQDWTILGSSTLPDYFETTGLGIGMGSFYERVPMLRTGFQLGHSDFKVQPEVAFVLPAFGEASLTDDQRARLGTRAGPESNRPEVQGRLVLQFPLVHASGVAPAQFIVSAGHSTEAEIVDRADLPTDPVPALGGRSIQSFFPQGLRESGHRNAWAASLQLPTSWATLVTKYYRGSDLRFYFAGQLNEVFFDMEGLTPLTTVTSFTNREIPILNINGAAVPAPLRPIRGQGGFAQLGLPLSRIFRARPDNRATAGWSVYLGYGVDTAWARDTVRPGGNGLRKTDLGTVSLRYRLNKFVTFVDEVSYLDTRAAKEKVFRGLPAFTAHAWRNELGTAFTF